MDRIEIAVRNMLKAIEAPPLYDVGVLSNRGMLRSFDSIPATEILERLSLLKYRNARGSHIYVALGSRAVPPVLIDGWFNADMRKARTSAVLIRPLGVKTVCNTQAT